MIVLDTSVVVALLAAGDARHSLARDWARGLTSEELVTTPLGAAEMDHLVARAGGAAGSRALRAELAAGAYGVEWWPEGMRTTLEVADRYESLSLGLVDASLVALAAHLRTVRIATFDERHFRVIQPLTGEPAFVLLPADIA